MSHAVVGGARASYYVRDISEPSCSVGAELYPGAAPYLFGAPAAEFGGRHTPLSDVWGRAADEARERLLEVGSSQQALDIFEALLAARLPAVRALHPCVAQALERISDAVDVREVVVASGYSHRRFIELFRRDVGLTPKLYCRVLRFQKALTSLSAKPEASWSELALACGYSDQSHFNREFKEFSGITPNRYRTLAPALSNHVPLLETH